MKHPRLPESPPPEPVRRYRGLAAEQRRAQRREQLIGAALAVYGERGYRSATVKAVCEAAGLTERYFYESFSGSEALLLACFDHVNAQLFTQIAAAAEAAGGDAAARARAMLRAYFQALQAEPRSARVFLLEMRGVSPVVDAAFEQALEQIGAAATQIVARGPGPGALLQAGVIGGVVHLASRWVREGCATPLAELEEAALALGLVLALPADPRPDAGDAPVAG